MKVHLDIGNNTHFINTNKPIDISIPLIFNGSQPNTYNVPIATAKPYIDGNFIGDIRQGGNSNFEEYHLYTHFNGTHTECVGHITKERISIQATLKASFIPATLITITPEPANKTKDTYDPPKEEADKLITKKIMEAALENSPKGDFLQALIIRTLPNDDSKKSRRYIEQPPAFFSLEAMKYLVDLKIKHLLLDLPSVDRTFDEGKLCAHHLFWNVPPGSHEVEEGKHSLNTITEMIYVPDEVKDGKYLLDIQIPAFVADAAPSRPMIYETSMIG